MTDSPDRTGKLIWSSSCSLATTWEFITFEYLDVSVPQTHHRNLRIDTCMQFPEAYRSLPRLKYKEFFPEKRFIGYIVPIAPTRESWHFPV